MSKKKTEENLPEAASPLSAEQAETPEQPETAAPQAERERDEWKDKALRAQAEFENYRKRTLREREALWSDARADTLAQLLPVYDNLVLAAANPTEDAAYAKGIAIILQQWNDVLAKMNVTPFGAAGDAFDPNLHDAMTHTEDESLPPNCVAEVFKLGFMIGDKVLRHAMVRAAN